VGWGWWGGWGGSGIEGAWEGGASVSSNQAMKAASPASDSGSLSESVGAAAEDASVSSNSSMAASGPRARPRGGVAPRALADVEHLPSSRAVESGGVDGVHMQLLGAERLKKKKIRGGVNASFSMSHACAAQVGYHSSDTTPFSCRMEWHAARKTRVPCARGAI